MLQHQFLSCLELSEIIRSVKNVENRTTNFRVPNSINMLICGSKLLVTGSNNFTLQTESLVPAGCFFGRGATDTSFLD